MLPPGSTNRRPQQVGNIEADTGLQHPLSTLHERRRRRPCKTRFRLAGCASTGRASNPLDRCERFQINSSSSFPGLALSQAEYSLALHFFLQEFQRLVDVIVADCNEQNISNLALANRRCGTQSRHATPRSPSFAPLSQRHDSTFRLPVSVQIVLPAFRSSPLTSKCWIFDPSSGAEAEVGNAPL